LYSQIIEAEMSDEQDPSSPPQSVIDHDAGLIEGLPPSIDVALRSHGLDTRDPDVLRAAEVTLQITNSSLPMPPPDVLVKYEKSFPGLVGRFIGWTEEQRKHRFSIEQTRVNREERRLDRSQIFAFITGLVSLGLATYTATISNSFGPVASWIVPCVIAIVGIGGPTAAVYLSRMNIKDTNKSD
jgi:uncharacterized membrane protein